MRRACLLVAIGAGSPMLTAVACATTRPVGEQYDDASITTRVAAKLAADPEIRKYEIDVDTLDNVVTLRGSVESQGDKEEAERIARNTPGVVRVDNELDVGTEADLFDENPDAWLTAKIESKLAADPQTSAMNVDVDTDDRIVTLSGIVPSRREVEEIERIARNTEGVEGVRNELQIEGESRPTPSS